MVTHARLLRTVIGAGQQTFGFSPAQGSFPAVPVCVDTIHCRARHVPPLRYSIPSNKPQPPCATLFLLRTLRCNLVLLVIAIVPPSKPHPFPLRSKFPSRLRLTQTTCRTWANPTTLSAHGPISSPIALTPFSSRLASTHVPDPAAHFLHHDCKRPPILPLPCIHDANLSVQRISPLAKLHTTTTVTGQPQPPLSHSFPFPLSQLMPPNHPSLSPAQIPATHQRPSGHMPCHSHRLPCNPCSTHPPSYIASFPSLPESSVASSDASRPHLSCVTHTSCSYPLLHAKVQLEPTVSSFTALRRLRHISQP
ncbi:hypothetical protein BKA56DRAFT_322111 [Ilyonectria sp. MPI-CAGE-AT-0026]|nr:hypothetical protein BKA56DRAFT_322111 [Ilyonectria sp. MPI-CAGE-AT-0026]